MLHAFYENPTWNGTSLIKVPVSRFVCRDSLIRKVKPYEINQVLPCNNKTLKHTPQQAGCQHNKDIMTEQNRSSQLNKGCHHNKDIMIERNRSSQLNKGCHVSRKQKCSPGQRTIKKFWKVIGNFGHLTHNRKFCHNNFFSEMINLWFPYFFSAKFYLALLRWVGMLS